MSNRFLSLFVPAICGCLAALSVISLTERSRAVVYSASQVNRAGHANSELANMVEASKAKSALNSKSLSQSTQIQIKRVHELYQSGQIRTGVDFLNAAKLLVSGKSSEDLILAHDLALLAISCGLPEAKPLSALAEDRFLVSIHQPPRFSVPVSPSGALPDGKAEALDPEVTNFHRSLLGVSTLSKTQMRSNDQH